MIHTRNNVRWDAINDRGSTDRIDLCNWISEHQSESLTASMAIASGIVTGRSLLAVNVELKRTELSADGKCWSKEGRQTAAGKDDAIGRTNNRINILKECGVRGVSDNVDSNSIQWIGGNGTRNRRCQDEYVSGWKQGMVKEFVVRLGIATHDVNHAAQKRVLKSQYSMNTIHTNHVGFCKRHGLKIPKFQTTKRYMGNGKGYENGAPKNFLKFLFEQVNKLQAQC